MEQTAIKIVRKSKGDYSIAAIAKRKSLNRPFRKGRPLKPSLKASKESGKTDAVSKEPTRKSLKNLKSKRKMSALEKLPTELLQHVFLYCLDLNLPRASPILAGNLSSVSMYSRTIIAAFGPTWDTWHGKKRTRGIGKDISGGDAELQSTILCCRWASLDVLLEAKQTWQQKSEATQELIPIYFINNFQPAEVPKTAKEYFEIDFAGFCDFTKEVDGTAIWHTCNWDQNTDVSDGIEIPSSLLAGPWTDDMIKLFFWLVKSGAGIDWINSTVGEVGIAGLRTAIIDGNIRAIHLLLWAGLIEKLDMDTLVWAFHNVGGDKQAVINHILRAGFGVLSDPDARTLGRALSSFRDEAVEEDDEEKLQLFHTISFTAMRATPKAQAPSSTLLRFLKSQSESVCFFSPNPRPGFIFDHAAPRSKQAHPPTGRRASIGTPRTLSTMTPLKATLEAGFPGLDFLFPQSALSALRPESRIPRGTSRHRRRELRGLPGVHHSSTNGRKWYQLWGSRSMKRGKPLHPDDLPPQNHRDEGGESMFSLGRHISAKAAAQPKLRCTELDENGNIVLTSGEFKKTELIQKYGLLPRDLRKIDSSILPHILVRPSAILINLLHLRVLIKANRVLVFDTYGTTDSVHQSSFIYDLEDKLRQQTSPSAGGLPYEFRAVEAVLVSVITGLEKEFEGVREPVVRVLRELEEDIDRDKLRYLLIYSKKLGTFEQKAKLVRDAIDELLEADDDLAAMYLTEKSHDIMRGEDDHTEVEMLLESYHKLCDEIVQESGNLVSSIRNTEEIVKAILDANRNSLMLLELKFSIGTLGIGSGAFVAALYGMNLKNFMEESSLGFFGVTAWSVVFAGVIVAYGLTKLRKVQKVTMWGEGGRRTGRNWRDSEVDAKGELEVGRRGVLDRHRRLREERRGAFEERRDAIGAVKEEVALLSKDRT